MLPPHDPDKRIRARASCSQPAGRFEPHQRVPEPDGWDRPDESRLVRTRISIEKSRRVITRNRSPDVPFDRSLNPYRGCEHGCIYCYARPSHGYLGLSAGLDFETRITAKSDAAQLLATEIAKPSYRVAPLALGTNTDPYQPAESQLAIMPGILQVLRDWNHPVMLVTRGQTVLRDIDQWAALADRGQATVGVSITTLDATLARQMEPRAPAPDTRLRMIAQLAAAGVPVRVMIAPVIPVLTEPELERIMAAAREAGARYASMIVLRLPHEVAPLFRDWLDRHMPGRAAHVMNAVRAMRGGRDNDSGFTTRMRGQGVMADLLQQRFRVARKRLGYRETSPPLDCSQFGSPSVQSAQLSLF